MRFIGDIHGKYAQYQQIAEQSEESVQIGDFGMGFAGLRYEEKDRQINGFLSSGKHKFIRGNHDNPQACEASPGWIPDGHFDPRGIMYIGGAWSIDRSFRTEFVDWWPDEEIGIEEFERIFDEYARIKPTIVVTHDAPHDVASELFFGPLDTVQYRTRTGSYLQIMLEEHEPTLWIFGHWHIPKVKKIGGTTFVCLGELNYIDIPI